MIETEKVSIIQKEDEPRQLRDEIMKRVEAQDPLFLASLTVSVTLLGFAVQFSGLLAAFLPVALLALALKINSHSTRIGQLNFLLRFVWRSPYEIVRRVIFDDIEPSEVEAQVLSEQGIIITPGMVEAACEMKPPLKWQKSLERWLLFIGFDLIAIFVLVTKTYEHLDVLAVGSWLIAVVSTALSVPVLRHKRVKRSLKEK